MALSFLSSSKCAFTALVCFGFLVMPSLSGIFSNEAQAQTFIERILRQDARKAKQQHKRPVAKRNQKNKSAKPETKPFADLKIPIPTPAPRPEDAASNGTAPVPDKRPQPAPTSPPNELLKPAKKDQRIYQVSCPALISGEVEGKLLPPIEDSEQCGTHSPLSLTAIGKNEPLKFANAVTTNCAMAVTLAQWSTDVAKAAKDFYGPDSKISEIGTGSDYQCRKVNGASAGRVSEHAFANALDIMSFTFSDGSKTQLESGWNGSEKEKAFWRAVHSASCKLFMTVIGPDGDAAHRTNMHLDQGCHGTSCLARICQ